MQQTGDLHPSSEYHIMPFALQIARQSHVTFFKWRPRRHLDCQKTSPITEGPLEENK